jgi:acetyl-CoA carboxylase biotin carboxyl carrier protein
MARHEVESEVTGNVWKVLLQVGTAVEEGDTIMILESMKMEIPVESPVTGTLVELCVAEEQQVEEEQVLAIVEA